MTTSKQQKIRIGLFAVAAGTLFVLVLFVFAGLHFWKNQAHYEIVFDHSVYGLQRGAEVYHSGIRVGAVDKISVDPADISKVKVRIEIEAGTPIRTDTKAILQFAGITGLKVIDLRAGSPTAPVLVAGGRIEEGETIIDKFERRAETMLDESTALMQRANQIAMTAQEVVSNLDTLTAPEQLGALVEQTKATAANLAAASGALKGLVEDNRSGLRASVASIELAAKHTAELVDDNRAGLKASITSIELATKRTAELVDNGQLRAAVADLRQASRSFKELARDVKARPSRLFFGKAEPDRKLP